MRIVPGGLFFDVQVVVLYRDRGFSMTIVVVLKYHLQYHLQ